MRRPRGSRPGRPARTSARSARRTRRRSRTDRTRSGGRSGLPRPSAPRPSARRRSRAHGRPTARELDYGDRRAVRRGGRRASSRRGAASGRPRWRSGAAPAGCRVRRSSDPVPHACPRIRGRVRSSPGRRPSPSAPTRRRASARLSQQAFQSDDLRGHARDVSGSTVLTGVHNLKRPPAVALSIYCLTLARS